MGAIQEDHDHDVVVGQPVDSADTGDPEPEPIADEVDLKVVHGYTMGRQTHYRTRTRQNRTLKGYGYIPTRGRHGFNENRGTFCTRGFVTKICTSGHIQDYVATYTCI